MCFEIKTYATRPGTTTVYRWLERLSHGQLVSPHITPEVVNAFGVRGAYYTFWELGERTYDPISDLSECSEGSRAHRGLYVWLNLSAARYDLRKFIWDYAASPDRLVLVECTVHPLDWLYTSTCDDAATYRAVRADRVLAEFKKDGCEYVEVSNV